MASWVRLNRKFDWIGPGGRSMKSFPVGDFYMTDDQAGEAERVGAGKKISRPDGKKTDKAGGTVNAR